ncbi:piggyBac transposable element-derived protein 4-like [Vespa crabro]|uniref:piggyBac transposable element-derived protein 4-like n=1 Tax=Vespa crabro TaxID=7445 RepID=UPI001F001B15|nr:piggyBac transposable element-derived protein 4-like [Vespa crabro]
MYCFFALSLLMTRNKKLALHKYWSIDKYLCSSIFSQVMTRNRYLWILQMIHFSRLQGFADNRLYKISDIINMLRKLFCDTFYPYEKVCIDESLMLYKGCLSFKQYIPSKRNRFGIKSYILCDCKTGYVQDLIVYEEKSTVTESDISGIGKSAVIVLSLLQPYLGQGHTLYIDNVYSSSALFNFLHDYCTNACGTVKKRRQGMPKMEERLKKGEACFRAAKNLLAMKWMDKNEVYMISTIHTVNFETVSRYGGEQSVRKPLKWYRKFFFHLINICVWNAYCMYKHNQRKTISMAKFHLTVIKQIVEKYRFNATGRQSRPADNQMRLTDRHFSTFCKLKSRRRRCVICSKNDKRTDSQYECKDCDFGLCIDPCFQIYHTELHY